MELKAESYTGTRLTFTSPTAFSTVLSRLYASIGDPTTTAWPTITSRISLKTISRQSEFISAVQAALGPHNLMFFWEIDHAAWLPFFLGPGLLGTEKNEISRSASSGSIASEADTGVVDVKGNSVAEDQKPPVRQIKRIVLGNPLIAVTMIKHDLDAGLAVPVELLLVEGEEGEGTEIVWQLPSALIARINKGKELVEAAEALDEALERLVRDIGE